MAPSHHDVTGHEQIFAVWDISIECGLCGGAFVRVFKNAARRSSARTLQPRLEFDDPNMDDLDDIEWLCDNCESQVCCDLMSIELNHVEEYPEDSDDEEEEEEDEEEQCALPLLPAVDSDAEEEEDGDGEENNEEDGDEEEDMAEEEEGDVDSSEMGGDEDDFVPAPELPLKRARHGGA